MLLNLRNRLDSLPDWALGCIIFVISIIVRLVGVNGNEIALDEPHTLFYSNASLDFIHSMMENENNPIGHYYFMHGWIRLFGHEVWVLRLPGIIATAFTGVAVFKIGRLLSGKAVGLISAAMFLLSNFIMVFAHEVRAYPFLLMFTALSLYFIVRYRSSKKTSDLVFLGLVNTLLVYFHFIGFIWILMQLAIFVMFYGKITQKMVIAYIITLILYLPGIPHMLNRFLYSESNGTWIEDTPGIDMFYNILWKLGNSPVAASLFILVIIVGLVVAIRKGDYRIQLTLATATFGSLLMIFVFSYITPLNLDRYMVFISVPLFILLAISSKNIIDTIKLKHFNLVYLVLPVLMLFNFKWFVDNERELDQIGNRTKHFINETEGIVYVHPEWLLNRVVFHVDEGVFWNWETFKEGTSALGFSDINSISSLDNATELPRRVMLIDGALNQDESRNIKSRLGILYGNADSVYVSKAYSLIYYSK